MKKDIAIITQLNQLTSCCQFIFSSTINKKKKFKKVGEGFSGRV